MADGMQNPTNMGINPLALAMASLASPDPGAMLTQVMALRQRQGLAQQQMAIQQAERQRQQMLRGAMVRAASQMVESEAFRQNPLMAGMAPDVLRGAAFANPDWVFQMAGRPAPERFEVMTAEQKRAEGLPVAEPYRRNTATGKVERIGAPATTIQVGGEFKTPGGAVPTVDPDTGVVTAVEFVPGTKEYETRRTQYKTTSNLVQNLRNFAETMRGPLGPEFMGAEKGRQQSQVTAMRLAAKEAEKLGALSGPDLALMSQLIPDPTDKLSWEAITQNLGWSDALASRYDAYADQIEQALRALPDYERFSADEPVAERPAQEESRTGRVKVLRSDGEGRAIIENDDDFDALPSGSRYVGPDGVPRVKP